MQDKRALDERAKQRVLLMLDIRRARAASARWLVLALSGTLGSVCMCGQEAAVATVAAGWPRF